MVSPTMFHYLLEMHKDGKVLLHMELNVPTESFPEVAMQSLNSLHRLLVDYGVASGYKAVEEEKGRS